VLTVITGPPCSGKSTEARRRHKPGGILIDYDALAQALGSPKPHDHPDPVRWVTIAARRAAIAAAIRQHHQGAHVVIVQTRISREDMDRYLQACAELVTLTVDTETLHDRATAERPERWHQLIDAWTPEPLPTGRPRAKTQDPWDDPRYRRGRQGRPWRRARAQVLARSRLCWICGHDASDSVDHVTPLSAGGAPLDPDNLRPAHHQPCPTCGRRCNQARGAAMGRGDTERELPSVTRQGKGRAPQGIKAARW
jgi:5-methylcytosine-specific restriction endonuclease McrA